ncbi:MAG: ATP-binding protein [Actinomycetota bacterium]
MDPVRNPYTPGAGTRPPALEGRDRELERFRVFLHRVLARKPEKGLIVTGLRGVGKTVLLNTFGDIAEAEGFITAHAEITEADDFPETIARLSRRALLALNPTGKLRAGVSRALGVLKAFNLKLPGGIEISIDVDAVRGRADSGVLEDDLPDLFVEIGEAALGEGKGVLFLLDEIQYLSEDHLAALITAVHRVAQRALPLSVVGAGLPQLPALAGEAKSYSERLFDFPVIGSLGTIDALEAIEKPARALQVDYEPSASRRIVQLADGYPYFLQEYGKHVWNAADQSPIQVADVQRAQPQVQAQLDENFFRVRVDRATRSERRYMRAMAELGSGPYRSGEVADILGVKVTSVGPTRAKLISKGFVYSPSHGFSEFTVPQFDDFMRRNFPHPREM